MTLLAPLFLTGLLAIGLPFLLHRMQEQNAPVESFPSSRFLEQTERSMSRRKKLRYRLLLALRMLLLAALCFLFAEPVVKLLRPVAGAGNEIHLIVLDNSFSMRHGDRWSDALQQVKDLVDEYSDKSDVVLRLASGELPGNRTSTDTVGAADGESDSQSQPAQSAVNRDLRVQLDYLSEQTPGLFASDYASMMDDAQNFAETQSKAVYLHVVSDAQRSAVNNGINSLYRDNLAGVDIYTVGADDDYNLSISSNVTWLDARSARLDSEILLSVASDSAETDSRINATIQSDAVEIAVFAQGQLLRSEPVQIQSGQFIQHQMLLQNLDESVRSIGSVSGNASRALTLNVELTGSLATNDKQQADNQVNLALPLNKPLQVAVLPIEPFAQKRDVAYLAAAFRQMYNVELTELDARVSAVDTATRLLIVLQGQGQVSLPDAAKSYWRNGGAVLQVLAGSSDADLASISASASIAAPVNAPVNNLSDDNQVLQNVNDSDTEPADNVGGYAGADPVTRVDAVHPLSLDRRGWASVQLSRPLWTAADLQRLADAVAQLSGGPGAERNVSSQSRPSDVLEPVQNALSYFSEGTDILLASDAGWPVLMQPRQPSQPQQPRESGDVTARPVAVLVLATPLDGLSTNLPVSPVFVPFMQSITDYMLHNRRYPYTLSSGSVLVLDGNTQLLTPDEEPVFDIASTATRQTHLLREAGTYTVLEQNEIHHIQVGIDPAESDIATLDDDSLELWKRQYLAQGSSASSGIADSSQTGSEQSTSSAGSTESSKEQRQAQHDLLLWRWLLPLLLVVMLFEIVYANRTFARFRGAS